MQREISREDIEANYAEAMQGIVWKNRRPQPSLKFWWYMEELTRADGSYPTGGEPDFVSFEDWLQLRGLQEPVAV